ncbi:DNA topoisomerase IV subunit A [Oenococcus sicerae]|uniref:DNA topoisomerase 4 subunit A n=1 Tax=Oenococcus sicerae TaxID=2203724 RepID=A0AAJ1RBK3_9LACO|nr:DNA topoisomerase IV subunit A [Oenococcus sicerae]MDN6899772.1 DNA topoisomerase IV subunit A [Oenococcus sicerae]
MAEESRIQELSLEDVMGERFGRYSKYIIQERALPDIRDGLKPVQRRILFAMNEDGNNYQHAYRKSAKAVGNVMGNYHPHGDSSIYDALVRMSQSWKMRETLIDMNGNNGSIDNDPPAAMRYTEARLSMIASEMLTDLDQQAVDMVLNFDDTRYEPTVLPSRIPNLLVNGASGISAGYATEIPPHNLSEVVNALIYLLAHPAASLDDLMTYVKGPDFPTGGIIQGIDGIKNAYTTGRGKIYLRSKTEIKQLKANKKQIEISELPYEVNKSALVARIDEIRVNKDVNGITEVRDDTSREGLLIVIELSKDANAEGILDYLFKKTDLQIAYNFNMTAIEKQRPVSVGLKQALSAFLDFRKEVIRRRTEFELKKAQKRQEIVEGLIKMLSVLDEVVSTIRTSESRKNAKDNLIEKFGFSDPQAEAIVTLQLYRLTNTDVLALQEEHDQLTAQITDFNLILTDPNVLSKVIKGELKDIDKKYASPRRSQIQAEVSELKIDTAVMIANEDVIVQITKNGYAKRASFRSYKATDENGLTEDDYPVYLARVNTLSHLFIFTNKGNLIYRQVYELTDSKWKDAGEHFSQEVSGMTEDETIVKVFDFENLNHKGSFVFASSDAFVKQVDMTALAPSKYYKKRASKAIAIKGHNQLTSVEFAATENHLVVLTTEKGYLYKFPLSEIASMTAKSSGAKPVKIAKKDRVVSMDMIESEDLVVLITDRGHLKIINSIEIPISTVDSIQRAESIFMTDDLIGGAQAINPESRPQLQAVTSKDQLIDFSVNPANSAGLDDEFKRKIKLAKNSIIVKVRLKQEVVENG